MIKLEKSEVMGWEHVIRGMRNPLNSWKKSDSYFWVTDSGLNEAWGINATLEDRVTGISVHVGDNDYDLMTRLRNAGTDHRKFMRMITVYVDITAPLYWWKEFDTYKVGTVANSCSTMHKIQAKEFKTDDFSHEHLINSLSNGMYKDQLLLTIGCLNYARKLFLETKDKKYWWQMIQLLPSSYNQKRTVMLNYEVLANMYKSRKNHKLDEWHVFCDWIKSLPYSELITGEKETSDE